jgi:hypothetical protein
VPAHFSTSDLESFAQHRLWRAIHYPIGLATDQARLDNPRWWAEVTFTPSALAAIASQVPNLLRISVLTDVPVTFPERTVDDPQPLGIIHPDHLIDWQIDLCCSEIDRGEFRLIVVGPLSDLIDPTLDVFPAPGRVWCCPR